MATLEAVGVGVRYHGRRVLEGVDLVVEPGTRLALIGPNGSGKTTLLRALAGIVEPAEGRVLLDGRPLAELGRKDVARAVGFLPQEEHWEFPFTVEEVARCGRFAHQRGVFAESDEDRACVERALEAVGLAALRARPVTELSGGERRRAVLARALAQCSPVLLLDEPTTALDLKHRHAVLRVLRDVASAVVLATHDLDVAAACGRVAMLHAGRLVAVGEPREVLTEQRLRDVFEIDTRVLSRDGRLHVVAEV